MRLEENDLLQLTGVVRAYLRVRRKLVVDWGLRQVGEIRRIKKALTDSKDDEQC